jgi:hypothetical protein
LWHEQAEVVEYQYELPPEYPVEKKEFELHQKVSRYKIRRYQAISDEILATYKQLLKDLDAIGKLITLCEKQIALSFGFDLRKAGQVCCGAQVRPEGKVRMLV